MLASEWVGWGDSRAGLLRGQRQELIDSCRVAKGRERRIRRGEGTAKEEEEEGVMGEIERLGMERREEVEG